MLHLWMSINSNIKRNLLLKVNTRLNKIYPVILCRQIEFSGRVASQYPLSGIVVKPKVSGRLLFSHILSEDFVMSSDKAKVVGRQGALSLKEV